MFRGLIIAALFVFIPTTTVWAQTSNAARTSSNAAAQEPGDTKLTRLMLGIDIKQTLTPSPDTANKFGVGFMWRWRSRTPRLDDRFAFAYRLGSYSSQLSSPMFGQDLDIGDARFRPIMAGFDYKMPRGKWLWSTGVTAGWSLNKLETSSAFRERVSGAMNSSDLYTDIHNSFAFSPRVKGWYDINRRVSFMVESSYAFTRPELTIRSGGVDMSRRLNADAFIVKAGLVYGVW